MLYRLAITIFGNVQGVGFRYEAQKQAKSLVLSGFARNQIDGTLYLEAEGEEEKIDKFIHWCQSGPQYAEVEKVVQENLPVKKSVGFIIKN